MKKRRGLLINDVAITDKHTIDPPIITVTFDPIIFADFIPTGKNKVEIATIMGRIA
jgi:hypothetical protein